MSSLAPMPEDAYLRLTRQERFELLDAGSRAAGLAPAILEKDYWVCRTLDVLFALPDLGEHLVFKGGTSLSKVFRLIERFSEDIDVSFHSEFLGFGVDCDPEAASGKEQGRRLDALREACTKCIRENLLPALKAKLHAEYHRNPAQPMPARYARHYHDLARLAASGIADAALAAADLRKRVVAHKSVYFRSKWARYDLAEPATFRLVPPKERFAELEKDNESMQEMFFSPPAPMPDVLRTLSALEENIHNLAT